MGRSILLSGEFASDAFMFLPPKTKTTKQWVRNDVILCNAFTIEFFCCFFFFPLTVRRISKQAELQLCSLEDDKCLPPMFLLALPAHHINQML